MSSQDQEVKYEFPRPPDILFKHRTSNSNLILNETAPVPLMTGRIDAIENYGVYIHYVGVPYCRKGFIEPEAIFALNQVKKIVIEFSKLLSNPFFLLGILTINKTKLCQSFNAVFNKIFARHVVKDEFMCRSAFNFANFLHKVLLSLKMNGDIAKEFSFNVAQIIDSDDAYRYRYQDICNELDVKLFKENPRKELHRLFNIFIARSRDGVPTKLKPLVSFASLVLLYPPIKKACIESIDFIKQSSYDNHDHYWVAIKEDNYNYFGMTIEERARLYTERPQFITVTA